MCTGHKEILVGASGVVPLSHKKKVPKASSTEKLQRAAEPGEKGTLQECCCSEVFILFPCVGCQVLVLESVNLCRKYISFLDVLISCLLPRDALFILTEEETEQAKVRCVAPAWPVWVARGHCEHFSHKCRIPRECQKLSMGYKCHWGMSAVILKTWAGQVTSCTAWQDRAEQICSSDSHRALSLTLSRM